MSLFALVLFPEQPTAAGGVPRIDAEQFAQYFWSLFVCNGGGSLVVSTSPDMSRASAREPSESPLPFIASLEAGRSFLTQTLLIATSIAGVLGCRRTVSSVQIILLKLVGTQMAEDGRDIYRGTVCTARAASKHRRREYRLITIALLIARVSGVAKVVS